MNSFSTTIFELPLVLTSKEINAIVLLKKQFGQGQLMPMENAAGELLMKHQFGVNLNVVFQATLLQSTCVSVMSLFAIFRTPIDLSVA
jgi:hypothetical protein